MASLLSAFCNDLTQNICIWFIWNKCNNLMMSFISTLLEQWQKIEMFLVHQSLKINAFGAFENDNKQTLSYLVLYADDNYEIKKITIWKCRSSNFFLAIILKFKQYHFSHWQPETSQTMQLSSDMPNVCLNP